MTINQHIEDLKNGMLDLLFPPRCVACGYSGSWWCIECQNKTEKIGRDLCSKCCARSADHKCEKRLSNLDAITVMGFYHDPKLRAVIHALKYKGATCLRQELGKFCAASKQDRLEPWPWAGLGELAIQHVPGSPDRIRERGFDQAELVLQIFRDSIVPWSVGIDVLDRHQALLSQAALDPGRLREANIAGCFKVKSGLTIPSNIILVDDVITTGSTMDEAARALRSAGAKKIFCLALAVGA